MCVKKSPAQDISNIPTFIKNESKQTNKQKLPQEVSEAIKIFMEILPFPQVLTDFRLRKFLSALEWGRYVFETVSLGCHNKSRIYVE